MLKSHSQDRWRIKRNICELAKRRQVILSISAPGTNPTDGTRNNEALEGVVRETGCLAFGGLVEEIGVDHFELLKTN